MHFKTKASAPSMKIKAFFSDPHFGHANILKYCDRPFDDIEEMNAALINNYNSMIGIDDVVIWMGDCFFKGDATRYSHMLSEMAGTKILLLGNHDRSDWEMADLGFTLVLREAVMRIAGRTCRLNHFPYSPDTVYEKPDKFKELRPLRVPGEILLHGHSHNKPATRVRENQIDVGVDAWRYRPALYSEVENLVRNMP